MTQYTAAEVRELVAGLPVLMMETGAETAEVEALRDALEGADQLLRELPEEERAEALVDDAQGRARANKKATARARRAGKKGLSSRLEAEGEVRTNSTAKRAQTR
jgi:hypothetical protein